ncbi:MAG: hypothetical protein GX640_09495 [Fibrobacter sp.]|nr:hypothetical protein [Fibrobacter sp.]
MKKTKILNMLILLTSATIIHAGPIYQDQSDQWSQIFYSSPLGQTFRAEDHYITFGFFIDDGNRNSGPNDYSIDYLLYEGSGVNGSLLSTKQFTGLYDNYRGYAIVDFSEINLSIGATYTVIVSNDNPRWGIFLSNRDVYSEGSLIMGGSPLDFCDAQFRVEPISKSIPEPGIFASIGIGLIAILLTKRKFIFPANCKSRHLFYWPR